MPILNNWQLVAALVIVLAGCAVRPPPGPPSTEEPVNFSTNDSGEATINSGYKQPGEQVTTATPIPRSPREDIDVRKVQRLVVTKLNRFRAGVDQPVFEDRRLSTIAQRKSYHMAKNGYFSHERPDGGKTGDWITAAEYTCLEYAENILKTHWKSPLKSLDGGNITSESQLASHVISTFDRSPPHRTAMLDGKFETVGIGVYVTDDGTVYVTMLLCD